MKKLCFIIIFIVCVFTVWADSDDDSQESDEKEKFSFKRRVEFGINAGVGIANDFLGFPDLFQDVLIIDLDKLKDGMQFDFATKVPFFFNYNHHDNWGFGLSIGVEAAGHTDLSGKMLSFKEAEEEESGSGEAVFAEAGAHAFFHINKFKVKVNAAFFYPAVYTKPDILYTYKTNDDGKLKAVVAYDMKIYTAFPMENFEDMPINELYGNLSGRGGVDIGGGVEYPLFPFLDLGVTLSHIPIVPAELNDYMRIEGRYGLETDDFIGGISGDTDSAFVTYDFTEYGQDKIKILRPFKLIFGADYRPFNTKLFSLKPNFGFEINPLYRKPFSLEGGLKIQTNVIDIVVLGLGLVYDDHLWKNSVDLALNFRLFELDIGAALQSEKLVMSWKGGGLAASVGLKFGW